MYSATLQTSRMIRTAMKDTNLPPKCYAVYYQIPNFDLCECQKWCKYPPLHFTLKNAKQIDNKNSLKQQAI